MAPSRRRGGSKAAAAAAAKRKWKVDDLVLAKVKGFPAWPAKVSEPEKWGYSTDMRKVFVYFFGTKQIAFCNLADVEEFTEEKKVSLLGKRQGRGADFVRAVQEIADCYDKLKEKSQFSCDDDPTEIVDVGIKTANPSAPGATHDLTLRSSSPAPKDEPSITVDYVGVLSEVKSPHQRGVSEESSDDGVEPILAMPNAYTLRKKARSYQPQRCITQKKGSVQRPKSPSIFDSHGLQNGVSNCNGGKKSLDGGTNGFWVGPLIKAKRSKRSPEGSIPNDGDSPMCNSNGSLDDDGSGVAMPHSENLSYNEGSVIESEHKHEREPFETINFSCEGGLEMSTKLGFKEDAIVRKKRNQGRKRAQSDGPGSTLRPDRDINKDMGIWHDQFVFPASCNNLSDKQDNQANNEGDEHLPLVKRARVRMGKMPSEEQQFDFLVKSEEKSSESALVSRDDGALISNDIHIQENVLLSNEPNVSSPLGNCTQVPENKTSPQKTYSCIVNGPMKCSPSDSGAQTSRNKPCISEAKSSQPFDCESALPPSKRLHRALEAMSANAAEETQISEVENPCANKLNKENHISSAMTCSNSFVEYEPCNKLDSQYDLSNCNNASHVEVSNMRSPSTCHEICRTSGDVDMPDSFNKDLVDNAVEMAVSIDGKDHCVSDCSGISHNAPQDQPLQALVTSVSESMPLLQSSSTVLIELPPEEFSKAEKDDMDEGVVEINKSVIELHLKTAMDPVSPRETLNDGRLDNTTILCGAANDIQSALVDKDVDASCLGDSGEIQEEVKLTGTEDVEASPSALIDSSPERTCYGASTSGSPSLDQNGTIASLHEKDVLKHVSRPNDSTVASIRNDNARPVLYLGVDVKLPHSMHVPDVDKTNCIDTVSRPFDFTVASNNNDHGRPFPNAVDVKLPQHQSVVGKSKCIDTAICHQNKSHERTNLAEVKAALASLELTLDSLSRTKESIGRATKIAVDCVKFGVAAEVVELLVLYLEKEASLHRRVDIFFLVDSILQSSRSLKGEVGGSYISAVKETLARMLSAAAPGGQAARDNRQQCLKVLRLWLERRILPESSIREHIQELDSLNCSTSGFLSRMSRTERSFDDPLRDMEGMKFDEYGSNSSFQLSGCTLHMLKEEEEEEEEASDSDDGSFEAVTPEHEYKIEDNYVTSALPASEKHRHILEDVDGELEMEDVAPSCQTELCKTSTAIAVGVAANVHHCQKQFTSFPPPLLHDVLPRAPPLPTSPPPLPPLPPLPPRPPLAPHVIGMPHFDSDPHLAVGRNSVQDAVPSRPSAPGVHHTMQMHASTSSSSYNSHPVMHNPVAPGNNLQLADANLYSNKAYNLRQSYPSSSNHYSYSPQDQQFRPQREVPPPSYYNRNHYGQSVDGHFYGDQDNARSTRPELTESWCPPRPDHTENWGPPRPEHTENWGLPRPELTENWCPPRPELTENWGYTRPPFSSSLQSENYACQPSGTGPSCESIRPQNHGWSYPPPPVQHQNYIPCGPPCDARGSGYWQPR